MLQHKRIADRQQHKRLADRQQDKRTADRQQDDMTQQLICRKHNRHRDVNKSLQSAVRSLTAASDTSAAPHAADMPGKLSVGVNAVMGVNADSRVRHALRAKGSANELLHSIRVESLCAHLLNSRLGRQRLVVLEVPSLPACLPACLPTCVRDCLLFYVYQGMAIQERDVE